MSNMNQHQISPDFYVYILRNSPAIMTWTKYVSFLEERPLRLCLFTFEIFFSAPIINFTLRTKDFHFTRFFCK